MKANGFTLVEILGVVVILSLIVILAFPSIIENIRKSEAKIDKASQLIIESAADIYMDNNKVDYPEKIGDVYCISFNDLIKSGNLKTPIIDTQTGKEISVDDKIVQVDILTEKKEYQIVTTCTENKN